MYLHGIAVNILSKRFFLSTFILFFIVSPLLLACAKQPSFNERISNPQKYLYSKMTPEIVKSQEENIKYLIDNANSFGDFDYIRFPYESKTIASEIYKIYSKYGMNSDVFDDARKQWYLNRHKNIDIDIRNRILTSSDHHHHKLKIGMTSDQILAAIGEPNNVRRLTDKSGVAAQWVYGGMIGNIYFPASYFYFVNDRLTVIQD